MSTRATYLLWAVWLIASLAGAVVAAKVIYVSGDRTALLPGETTGVHHQFEVSCETCHSSDDFEDANSVRKDLNKTCVACHKEELKTAEDSHPIKKFSSPRMAAYWEKVDGRFCTSCHLEHVPEETLAGMLTLPGDYCVACHSEGDQDVRVNRVSHANLTFDTCASSGCHNYHDNRALYEDFLVKHGDAPWIAKDPILPAAALARERARPEVEQIETYLAALDRGPAEPDPQIDEHWAASAHAAADVGCAGCHAPEAETPEAVEAAWIDAPGEEVCADCHRSEAKTFAMGRHGMRRHPEIAAPRDAERALKDLGLKNPPEALVEVLQTYLADPAPAPKMTTAEARIDLKPEAHGQEVGCNTCHKPHEQNVEFAAVGACLACHSDDHSLAYQDSPHAAIWNAEKVGHSPAGSGVTCATCHMPKEEKGDLVLSNHNQNGTLRPNEKMIRPVCMSCHSLEFAIDALADPALVTNNFSGQPMRHIESIDWALNRVEPPDTDANQ